MDQGRDSQDILGKILHIFVTSGPYILRLLIFIVFLQLISLKVNDNYCKIIKNLFSNVNWITNTSESYENLTNLN